MDIEIESNNYLIDDDSESNDNWIVYHTLQHIKDRRRSSKKTYMICGYCQINYLFIRPKKQYCKVCNRILSKVTVVDEFEIERIKSWAGTHIYEEKTEKESC